MSDAAITSSRMTAEEFDGWYARQTDRVTYELVDGYVYPKYGEFVDGQWKNMGLDRKGHNRAKLAAATALMQAAKRERLPYEAFVDGLKVRVSDSQVRVPDAILDCGTEDDASTYAMRPTVVVEVVSPSSDYRDKHNKLWEYFQNPYVHHCLIVFPEDAKVVHHKRKSETDAQVDTAIVSSGVLSLDPPGMDIAVNDLLGAAP